MAGYTFEAVWRQGDDDFDAEFDILDKGGNLLGRCGAGLGAQIGEALVAIDVWLHDFAEDAPPLVTFLLTEYALNDDGVYHTLDQSGQVLRITQGLTVRQTGSALRLEARIEAVAYGEAPVELYGRRTLISALFGRRSNDPDLVLEGDDYISAVTVTLSVERL